MPLYQIAAPNGKTYEIEGPEGASQAQVIAAILAQDPSAGQPAPPVRQSTIGSEFIRGIQQPFSSARTGAGSLIGSPAEAASAGLQRGQEISEAAGEGPSFERLQRVYGEKGVLAAGRQALSDLPKALAGQGGTLATMYLGGKLGATAGAPLGPVGALVGGAAGATAALLPSMFGSNVERQAAEQQRAGEAVDPNLGRAAAAAAGQAALESVGTGIVLGKRVIGGLLGLAPTQLATDVAKDRLVKEAARTLTGGVVRGAAVEMPVEIAQSVIERAQAGLDVTSDDAFKEYSEAAYLAGLVGGPLGGAGTAVSRSGARRELAAQEPPPQAQETPPEEPAVPQAAVKAPADMSIGELYQEEARLSAMLDENRRQPDVAARIKEVRALKTQYNITDAENALLAREARQEHDLAAQAAQATQAAPEVEAAPQEPVQGEFRATMITPQQERALQRQVQAEPPVPPEVEAAPAQEFRQLGLPGITPVEEIVTPDLLAQAGLPAQARTSQQIDVAQWMQTNVAGKALSQVRALVQAQPDLTKGSKLRAHVLKNLLATAPPPFEERQGELAGPALPEPAPAVTGRRGAGLEVPDGGVGERGGDLAPAAGVGAPAGRGVAPAGRDVEPRDAAEGAAPAPVAPAPEVATPVPEVAAPAPETAAPSRAPASWVDTLLLAGQTPAEPEAQPRKSRPAKKSKKEDEVDPEELSDDYGLDTPPARPTVTLTATGRKVEGIRYAGPASQAVPLAPEVQSELETGTVVGALNELSKTTTNPMHAQIAKRLMLLLGNTSVTIAEDLRNDDGDPAAGAASTSGRRIWIDRNRGMNEETLLHEAVHAGTEAVLDKPEAERTALQNAAVRELNALWNAAKADPNVGLSEDAAASISEFVTEAMTNPTLVAALKAKPWTISNAWDGFKRILLKMMGVDTPRTMQDAVVASVDTIFARPEPLPEGAAPTKEGVRYASPQQPAGATVEQTLAAMRPGPQQNSLKAMIKGAFGSAGQGPPGSMNQYVVSTEAKIRTRVSDRAATVFEALMNAVNKGMITEMAARQTQVVFKQAEAANQMTPEFMRRGAIERNPVGGWRATALKGSPPPVAVFAQVEAWGKSRGLTMENAWADAARLIESGRQYEFRAANRAATPGDPKLPVSMSDAQIDQLYPAYKADPVLADVKKTLDASRLRLIDQMVEVGRLSKAEGQIWKDASEYVPFDRLTELNDKIRQQKNIGRGLASLGGLPKLVDAEWVNRPVGNALENYFGTLGWMMEQVVRTDAINKTVAQLEAIGQAEPRGFNQSNIRDRAKAVKTYRNGQEYWYETPTIYHAVAFNSAVAPMMGFVRVLGTISRMLRTAITAIPTFTASQLPQDIQRAILYSGVKDPAALTAKALVNFKILGERALRGTLSTATPGQSASGLVGDVDFRANDPARSLLEEFGYASPTLLKSKTAGRILHRLNEVSRASDIAIRKAIYDQTMLETKGDELLALQRAREIINFRTTGTGDPLHILPFMIQTIPFFNAYIQGTDVLYRGLTGKGAVSGLARKQALKQFYTVAGSIAAGSMLYALAMAGDDEYENMDLAKRDRTWVLGGGLSLPVPSEIGILFKAIPERVVDAMTKYGTPDQAAGMTAVSSWFRAAAMEYGGRLAPIPAATRPVLEAWTNYSMRTGRELEGAYQEGLVPSERVTSATSDFAREVARFSKAALGVEVSPIKIDNTLNGYFGTTATLTLATMDALTSDRADRPLHRFVGLAPFTYDTVGTRQLTEFYDLRKEVAQAQNTLNMLMRQSPEMAMQFAEANKEKLMVYKAVNGTLKQLQQTRNYKNWLDTSVAARELSSDERMRRKQEVQAHEQKLVEWNRMARKELGL